MRTAGLYLVVLAVVATIFLVIEPGVAVFMLLILLPYVLAESIIQERYVHETQGCVKRYARRMH